MTQAIINAIEQLTEDELLHEFRTRLDVINRPPPPRSYSYEHYLDIIVSNRPSIRSIDRTPTYAVDNVEILINVGSYSFRGTYTRPEDCTLELMRVVLFMERYLEQHNQRNSTSTRISVY